MKWEIDYSASTWAEDVGVGGIPTANRVETIEGNEKAVMKYIRELFKKFIILNMCITLVKE